MKKQKQTNEKPETVKRKFYSALCMLLISAILLTTTSYAWLIMSTAPEVTGIATNIGANGSLEIALLTSETRQNLDSIKTTVGQSLVNNKTAANHTWGNLIDLNDSSYGLSNITLMPARLNWTASGDEYIVNDGMLSVPTYGYDGRIIELDDNTVSAIYSGDEFAAVLGTPDFGVRAIGTSDTLSAQGSALAMAKSNIVTYTNSAKNGAIAAMTNNIDALMDMVIAHSTSSATYDSGDLETLQGLIADLKSSVNYIDLTLRQGLVAYAASQLGDETKFGEVRDYVTDSANSLGDIVDKVAENTSVPDEFNTWVENLGAIQNDLNAATNACNALSGSSFTWTQLRGVLDYLMNLDDVYIDGTKFSNMSTNDLTNLMGSDFAMTLGPNSGVFARIADFTGNFSSWMSMFGSDVEIKTMSTVDPAYLTALNQKVKTLEAADGSVAGETKVTLTSTYGYALDMAFRCNAAISDLLLQTDASQRIYDTSAAPSTMGGGSYMEFSTTDHSFSLEQQIKLMDAVRVGFIDDQGTLLGIAKLNTSNRTTEGELVRAPLYLYEYSFSEEAEDYGALIMGERRKTDNTIVSLQQNVAKAITVLVWLDGDIVDNSYVSAEAETSLNGVLNLQFASSADLIPADNSNLMYLTPDKTVLQELLEQNAEIYAAGQGMHTTASWTAYAEAYEYAAAVSDNPNANEAQVLQAMTVLTKTKAALEEVSLDVLGSKIEEMREFMGKTEDLARYVLHNATDGYYYSVDPYTEEQKDSKVGEIYRVNYENNLHDEGNDVKTPIYTDESWSNLASALYDAEVLYQFPGYTDYPDMDAAITAMQVAYDALQRRVFYIPYDYEGALYYFAISDETDTYGKWYDVDFKRVVSDLRILELDAMAEPVDIAEIIQDAYIKNEPQAITPYINILDEYYPSLSEEEILAIHWSVTEQFTQGMTPTQKAYIKDLIHRANTLQVGDEETAAAQSVLDQAEADKLKTITKEEAETVIESLEAVVIPAEEAEAQKKADEEAAAHDPETSAMTPDQRTVLTAAISAAKTVEGYDSTQEPAPDDANAQKIADLKKAVEEAEQLLAQETGATEYLADEALSALNEQLIANGMTAVTAYNTILHSIPVGSEVFEVTHAVDFSSTLLHPTTDTDQAAITATVLTRNGILFTAKKNVTVYAPATGAEIDGSATATVGSVATLNATLTQAETQKLDENGEVVLENGEPVMVPYSHGESIKECVWASSSTSVLTVSGTSGSVTIHALSAGTAVVTVSVYTVQGNVYTTSITITVTG